MIRASRKRCGVRQTVKTRVAINSSGYADPAIVAYTPEMLSSNFLHNAMRFRAGSRCCTCPEARRSLGRCVSRVDMKVCPLGPTGTIHSSRLMNSPRKKLHTDDDATCASPARGNQYAFAKCRDDSDTYVPGRLDQTHWSRNQTPNC